MVIFGVLVDGEMIPMGLPQRYTPEKANVLCQILTAATGMLWVFDFA